MQREAKHAGEGTRNSVLRCLTPVLSAILLVTGCASDETKEGMIGYVEGFVGGVVADEPRAALIGREILSSGGTAADAAVAVYFALSVTLPSSASLGGGGVCVVHHGSEDIRKKQKRSMRQDLKTTQVLEFLPRAPSRIRPGATRPTAIPANARGFYALYAKYGRLRWSRLVAPAENLARFGFQVSRAMAREIAAIGTPLMVDAEAKRIFGGKSGAGVTERDFIVQTDLSAILGAIRAKGPGDFYSGTLARHMVEATNAAGGSLSIEDLRTATPSWQDSLKVPFGNLVAHFPPPPAAGGATAAQMWGMLTDGDRFEDAEAVERLHLLAEAAIRAQGDRARWMRPDGSTAEASSDLVAASRIDRLMAGYSAETHTGVRDRRAIPENPAATGFVTVDSEGSAVACTVTNNNLFGTGRVARGTGIVLAAAPDRGGRGYTALGPMLAINHHINQFHFGAAASGGKTAVTALDAVAARTLLAGDTLEDALAAKRVHHGGSPDVLYHEQGLSPDLLAQLRNRGHAIAATPVLGLVNAISCPGGLPSVPKSCEVHADPRGFGLSAASLEE